MIADTLRDFADRHSDKLAECVLGTPLGDVTAWHYLYGMARRMDDEHSRALEENAKLRELAHDMWRLLLATGNDDLVLSLEVNGVVKEVIDAEELAKTMRELGIEVY